MKDQLIFLSFVFIALMSASSYFQIVFFCDWMRYVLMQFRPLLYSGHFERGAIFLYYL